jgi:hypothetical protein
MNDQRIYLKFPPNTRVEGTAKFQGVRPVMTDKYGEKWLFTLMDVDGTGEERGGTISQALAEKLTDVQVGDMVIIMKQDDGGGAKEIRWRVSVNSVEIQEGSTRALEHVSEGDSGGNASRPAQGSTGRPMDNPDVSLAQMGQLMAECMGMAKGVGEDARDNNQIEFGTEDIRTIGISLFIEANRKGITANSIEPTVAKDPFGDPGPTEVPTEDEDDDLPF